MRNLKIENFFLSFARHVSWALAWMLSRCVIVINWCELRDSLPDFSKRWQERRTRVLLCTIIFELMEKVSFSGSKISLILRCE